MGTEHTFATGVAFLQRRLTAVATYTRRRRERPYLGMLGVPLLMTATMLQYLWWTWPVLVFCAWWWAPRSSPWAWIVAVEAGALGVQWACMGAISLGAYPAHRPLVEALWFGGALLLFAIARLNRRYGSPGY